MSTLGLGIVGLTSALRPRTKVGVNSEVGFADVNSEVGG